MASVDYENDFAYLNLVLEFPDLDSEVIKLIYEESRLDPMKTRNELNAMLSKTDPWSTQQQQAKSILPAKNQKQSRGTALSKKGDDYNYIKLDKKNANLNEQKKKPLPDLDFEALFKSPKQLQQEQKKRQQQQQQQQQTKQQQNGKGKAKKDQPHNNSNKKAAAASASSQKQKQQQQQPQFRDPMADLVSDYDFENVRGWWPAYTDTLSNAQQQLPAAATAAATKPAANNDKATTPGGDAEEEGSEEEEDDLGAIDLSNYIQFLESMLALPPEEIQKVYEQEGANLERVINRLLAEQEAFEADEEAEAEEADEEEEEQQQQQQATPITLPEASYDDYGYQMGQELDYCEEDEEMLSSEEKTRRNKKQEKMERRAEALNILCQCYPHIPRDVIAALFESNGYDVQATCQIIDSQEDLSASVSPVAAKAAAAAAAKRRVAYQKRADLLGDSVKDVSIKWNRGKDLASQIKESTLQDMFGNMVCHDVLNEVLEQNDNRMDKAIKAISKLYIGTEDGVAEQEGQRRQQIQQQQQQQAINAITSPKKGLGAAAAAAAAAAADGFLVSQQQQASGNKSTTTRRRRRRKKNMDPHRPARWQEVLPEAAKKKKPKKIQEVDETRSVASLREEAHQHAQLRNYYYRLAVAAFMGGKGQEAKRFQKMGQTAETNMHELQRAASKKVFSEKNAGFNSLDKIDLHGLYVKEALEFLDRRINTIRATESSSPWLTIITGSGMHSHRGRPILLPKVKEYLYSKGHKFTQNSPGSLRAFVK